MVAGRIGCFGPFANATPEQAMKRGVAGRDRRVKGQNEDRLQDVSAAAASQTNLLPDDSISGNRTMCRCNQIRPAGAIQPPK
jgi:hypothetical protein